MQPDFEKNFMAFLESVRTHFERQNASLREYERFFEVIAQSAPQYMRFVDQVIQLLSSKEIPVPSSGQKKVLIVDDAEINRILLGHFFRNLPVSLEFAFSGEQALSKSHLETFDLILMDLQLKHQSGIDIIREIRKAHPETAQKTQIVAISNQEPNEEERTSAMNAGANEYLTKSLSREQMRDRIFSVLFGIETISA